MANKSNPQMRSKDNKTDIIMIMMVCHFSRGLACYDSHVPNIYISRLHDALFFHQQSSVHHSPNFKIKQAVVLGSPRNKNGCLSTRFP